MFYALGFVELLIAMFNTLNPSNDIDTLDSGELIFIIGGVTTAPTTGSNLPPLETIIPEDIGILGGAAQPAPYTKPLPPFVGPPHYVYPESSSLPAELGILRPLSQI